MSSLASQLAAINANNDTIIDKRSRKKVHSVSLIYEPKVAAVQDYDTIYSASLEALRELEILDGSFSIFEDSLFSETSIGVDRSVQTSEQNELLDKAIDNFLSLLAPRIHLQPAIKALEWLVRRFQIHTHNSEILLLTILPYYSSPVFLRVLDIVTLPPLFTFLKNSKTNIQNPSKDLIIRALATDSQVCELVQSYITRIILSKRAYHGLLAFWSSTSIWTMISLKESGGINEQDIVGRFLGPCSSAIALKKDPDAQIAAYIILAVLGSQFRLNDEVKTAAIQSIALHWSKASMKSGFSCITQLVKLDETFEPFDKAEWDAIDKIRSIDNEINALYDQYDISQFIVRWGLSVIKYSPEKISLIQSVLSHGELSPEDGLSIILKNAIILSTQPTSSVIVKEQLVILFEFVLSSSEEYARCFKDILSSVGVSFDQLELNVQSSIQTKFAFVKGEEQQPATDNDIEMNQVDEISPSELLSQELKSRTAMKPVSSFLCSESNDQFKELVHLFTLAVQSNTKESNILDTLQISSDSQPSFLIRVWTGAYANLARVNALELFSNILEKSPLVDYQAVVPFLIVALADESERIRRAASSVIRALAVRYPGKKISSVWALDNLYGDNDKSSGVKWLTSSNIKSLLNDVILSNIDECYLDSEYISKRISNVASDREYKSLQEPLLTFLTSHALSMQLPQMKISLLRVLNKWGGKANATSKLLYPLLSSWIDQRESWIPICQEEKASFDDLENSVVNIVSSGEKGGITFLEQSIKSSYPDLSSKAGQRIVNLWKSSAFKSDTQLSLLRFLSEIAVDESVSFDSLEVLNNIDIHTSHFISLLDDCKLERETAAAASASSSNAGSASPAVIPKRRRRSSNSSREKFRGSELISFAEKHLRKLTVILELLDKNKPEGASCMTLLSQLFTILGEILSLGTDSNLPALYTEQLLANCMIVAVQELKTQRHSKIDSSIVRVDIIVSCIRSSTSPQVQNRFLLLVASLAELAPEVVLHSVMPIFTFMGANTIRQDDEFSAHVIQQTISQVIPALVSNSSGTNNDEIEFLLLSFVAAFAHIPRHRRVKLFGALVKTLKPEESLHKLLILFGNKYSESKVKRKSADLKSYVQFGEIFVRSFSVVEQVIAIKSYLNFAELIPLSDDESITQSGQLFTAISSGPGSAVETNAVLKANLYEFLTNVFGNDEVVGGYQSLRVQILKGFQSDDNKVVMDICSDIIEQLLKTRKSTSENNALSSVPSLGENVFQFLGKSLELLPVGSFVMVVRSLLSTTDNDVRVHALVLIQSKFELELSTDEEALKAAIDCIGLLREYLLSTNDANTIQLVLDDLDIIVSKFGGQMNPDDLQLALTAVIGEHGLLNSSVKVFVAAVSATNSICSVLGARMIGLFGKIIPVVFKRFESTLKLSPEEEEAKFVQLSTFGLISGLVKRIPSFMTSSIKKILELIFTSNAAPVDVRARLLDVIKLGIDNKQVISALTSTWKYAVNNGMDVINLFLDSLDGVIEISPKKIVSSQSSIIVGFLLEAFEVRQQGKHSKEDTNRIESKVVNTSIQIVMKLNDKTFQPLFVRIVRWAMEDDNEDYSKKIVFFKFLVKLLSSLKSIVTSYYGYILDPVGELLDKHQQLPDTLRRNILNSLVISFQNDNDEFWQSQARFDKISTSLLSQIPTIESSMTPLLVKAIVSLSEVCSSADHHKTINERICSYMKADCTTNEKICAVKTVHGLYNKLGEEWVSMLPQLVPLIAELLEDENEQVELEVRRNLVPAVEEVLGESLDRYLS